MAITVRVTKYSECGLDTYVHSIREPTPNAEDAVRTGAVLVTSEGLFAVTDGGEVSLIDDLKDAERVTVGVNGVERVIWPKDKVRL